MKCLVYKIAYNKIYIHFILSNFFIVLVNYNTPERKPYW